jgi:hypothetical protein
VDAKTITTAQGRAVLSTPLDNVIDMVVQQRAAVQNLSTADALVLREQLQAQYLSLSAMDQQKLLDAARNASSAEGASATIDALASAVQATARQLAADMAAESAKARTNQNQQITPKLGTVGPDLVFVPTAGPCRVADTRFGIMPDWPGPIQSVAGRQIYVYSAVSGYSWATSQGGTGTSSTGNCVGSEFLSGPAPVAVVATISVTNTSSTGALRAWDGTPNLTTGAAATWTAGGTQANTTVVPINRTGVIYPGSGPFKKDIGVYNNSATPIDVIVDVVGYFIENTATPLECTNVTNTSVTTTSVDVLVPATACPAGFTPTGINCASSANGGNGVRVVKSYILPLGGGTPTTGNCRFENIGGLSQTYWGYLTCCRVPGR